MHASQRIDRVSALRGARHPWRSELAGIAPLGSRCPGRAHSVAASAQRHRVGSLRAVRLCSSVVAASSCSSGRRSHRVANLARLLAVALLGRAVAALSDALWLLCRSSAVSRIAAEQRRLTTRCSGLATLAAELDIVRPPKRMSHGSVLADLAARPRRGELDAPASRALAMPPRSAQRLLRVSVTRSVLGLSRRSLSRSERRYRYRRAAFRRRLATDPTRLSRRASSWRPCASSAAPAHCPASASMVFGSRQLVPAVRLGAFVGWSVGIPASRSYALDGLAHGPP